MLKFNDSRFAFAKVSEWGDRSKNMNEKKKIFIHDFPLTNSNEKLLEYIQDNPILDPEYITLSCGEMRQETKAWIEALFEKYRRFAESNFLKKLRRKGNFHAFTWQMYLAVVILEKGYSLRPNSGKGPDLQIKIADDKNLWIEATTTTPGADLNTGGLSQSGEIYQALDPRVARISNALTSKYQKYQDKYLGSICREDEPFIIAINGTYTDTMMGDRAAEATVYGRGNDVIKIKSDGSFEGGFYELRESVRVEKEHGLVSVPTNYFCDDSYNAINGIIYCEHHIINANNFGRTPEGNLYFLSNPHAENPIGTDVFSIGKIVYMNKDRQIIRSYEKF